MQLYTRETELIVMLMAVVNLFKDIANNCIGMTFSTIQWKVLPDDFFFCPFVVHISIANLYLLLDYVYFDCEIVPN